jgi:hypothetical protein
MAHAEVVGIHVFLGELALDAQRSNPVAQGAEETGVVGWDVSAGGHLLRLPTHEQKEHEHKDVSMANCYMRPDIKRFVEF